MATIEREVRSTRPGEGTYRLYDTPSVKHAVNIMGRAHHRHNITPEDHDWLLTLDDDEFRVAVRMFARGHEYSSASIRAEIGRTRMI